MQIIRSQSRIRRVHDNAESFRIGWDAVRLLPTAPEKIWIDFIEAHPFAEKYRPPFGVSFLFFDELAIIFSEKVAATLSG